MNSNLYSRAVTWHIWASILCVFVSFCFSAAETALTSLGRLENERLLSLNAPWKRILKIWIHQPERILILILIGNNIANILASSFVTLWAEEYYPRSLAIAIGAFTFIVVFGAEVLPKIFARQYPERFAPATLSFLRVVSWPLSPATWALEKLSRVVIWALGFDLSKSVYRPFSEEEVTQTIELATIQGGLDPVTGETLSNLMEFPDMRARDVMTARSRMKVIHVKMTFDEVMRLISQDSFSRYPVYRENFDDVVGIIHVKDLMSTLHRGLGGVVSSNWTRAIRRPYFVSEMASLGEILRDMKRWGTHLAVVRNETGVVTGLLTLEDLLEEIVGEIRDEHDDPSEAGYEGPIGGPQIVSGEMSIIDFNDRFGGDLLMDEGYSTLNGYVLKRAGGTMPSVGTLIIDEKFSFKLGSINEQGIASFEVIEIATTS